jgi:hypothetical protein
MKWTKLVCFAVITGFGVVSLSAQEVNRNAQPKAKNKLAVGVGVVNFLYFQVNSLDDKQLSSSSFFAGITKNETLPLHYIKYENQLGRHHTLGLNYASAGFVVGGVLRDSVFLNELGIETQTTLDVTYRTRSYNVRYNYIFNPDGAVVTYLGLGVGMRGNSLSAKANDPSFGHLIKLPGFNVISYPILGFESTLGFKGTIADQLGWYAEMGIAKSIFQGGISYSF